MLGGFGSLNDKDIDQSRKFLDKIKLKTNMKLEEALECGAGIGRITKQLLCNVFQTVKMFLFLGGYR